MEENNNYEYEEEEKVSVDEALDVMIENWIARGEEIEFNDRSAENYAKALTELFRAKAIISAEDDRRELEHIKVDNEASRIELEKLRIETEKLRADAEKRKLAVEFEKTKIENKKVKAMNWQTFWGVFSAVAGGLGSALMVYKTWEFEKSGNFMRYKNACMQAAKNCSDRMTDLIRKFKW